MTWNIIVKPASSRANWYVREGRHALSGSGIVCEICSAVKSLPSLASVGRSAESSSREMFCAEDMLVLGPKQVFRTMDSDPIISTVTLGIEGRTS